ncbi:MAG TPA: hypothetical protein VGE52_06670 [Pirellulales bacterium]
MATNLPEATRRVRIALLVASAAILLVSLTNLLSWRHRKIAHQSYVLDRIEAAGGSVGPLAFSTLAWIGLEIPVACDVGLSHAELDDELLELIASLETVEYLNVSERSLSDDDFISITQVRSIKSLSLQGARFNSGSVAHIRKLPELTQINLCQTSVACDAIMLLREVKNLTLLDISGTLVSDECVNVLAGITTLRSVNTRFSLMTDAGRARLAKLRPDVSVL